MLMAGTARNKRQWRLEKCPPRSKAEKALNHGDPRPCGRARAEPETKRNRLSGHLAHHAGYQCRGSLCSNRRLRKERPFGSEAPAGNKSRENNHGDGRLAEPTRIMAEQIFVTGGTGYIGSLDFPY